MCARVMVALAAAASVLMTMVIEFDCVHAREEVMQVQEAQKRCTYIQIQNNCLAISEVHSFLTF